MKKLNRKSILVIIALLLAPLSVKGSENMVMNHNDCSINYLMGSVKLYKVKDLKNCEGTFIFRQTKKGIEFERNVDNLMQKTPLDTTATKSEEDAKLLTVLSNNTYTFYVKEKWSGRLFAGTESSTYDPSHLTEVDGEYYISLRLLSEILKANVTVGDNSFSLNPISEVTVVSMTYTVPDEEIPEPVISNPVNPKSNPICETDHIVIGSECPSYMVNNSNYEMCNITCSAVASKKEEIVGRVYDIFNYADVSEIKANYTHPKYPSSSVNWDEFVPWLKSSNKESKNYYYAIMRYIPMTGPNCTGSEVTVEETFGTAMFGTQLAGENPYGRPTHDDMFSRGYTCSERYVWVIK